MTLIEPIKLLLLKAFRAEVTGDRVENCDASSGVGETYFRSCWALNTHVSWWSYHTLQNTFKILFKPSVQRSPRVCMTKLQVKTTPPPPPNEKYNRIKINIHAFHVLRFSGQAHKITRLY